MGMAWGDRAIAGGVPLEESPRSTGQDAGQLPDGITRGQGHRNIPPVAVELGTPRNRGHVTVGRAGKGEMVV